MTDQERDRPDSPDADHPTTKEGVGRSGLDCLRPAATAVIHDTVPATTPASPTPTPIVLAPAIASSSKGPIPLTVRTASTVRYSVPSVTKSVAQKRSTQKWVQSTMVTGGRFRKPSPPPSAPAVATPDKPPPPKLSKKEEIEQKMGIPRSSAASAVPLAAHHEDEGFFQGLKNFMGVAESARRPAKTPTFAAAERKRKGKELADDQERERVVRGLEWDRDESDADDDEEEAYEEEEDQELDDDPFREEDEEEEDVEEIGMDQPE
ncbi:unnamed protein product [Closterium sp. NIES-64]|nr:unnamed protein product [Closterium sp. NIES-64]